MLRLVGIKFFFFQAAAFPIAIKSVENRVLAGKILGEVTGKILVL
jgi:hypothetical protein